MSFRCNAKNFFLTYPQSTNLNHEYLHDHLTAFRGGAKVYSCREAHEDGGFHHHAIVSLPNKYNCKNERAFDLVYQGTTYHPKIEAVHDLRALNIYIAKDGDTKGEPIQTAADRSKDLYGDLARCGNTREFMEMAEARDPKNFILNNDRLESFARKRWGIWEEPRPAEFERDTFSNVPDSLTTWVNEELNGNKPRPKCLILVGGPDLGKTSWARSLGIHHEWNNRFTKDRVKGAKYAIFNDFDTLDQDRHEFKGIWGSQDRVGVKIGNGKSGHTTWDWGIPSIWTFNPTSLPLCIADYNGYERTRNTFVRIDEPLY